jgi:hypothetical protein
MGAGLVDVGVSFDEEVLLASFWLFEIPGEGAIVGLIFWLSRLP